MPRMTSTPLTRTPRRPSRRRLLQAALSLPFAGTAAGLNAAPFPQMHPSAAGWPGEDQWKQLAGRLQGGDQLTVRVLHRDLGRE